MKVTWYLTGRLSNMGKVESIDVTTVPFQIGRRHGLPLSLSYATVSSTHAEIKIEDGYLQIRDAGSTNGTFINGERISYGMAMKLSDYDVIKFGTIEVVFERLEPESAESPTGEISSIDGIEFRNRKEDADLPDDTVKIEPKASE